MFRKCLAEAIGTYAIVFAGTGAIVVNDLSGGAITHPGIAIVFGLVVMSQIYALGKISGAHLNPAVTLSLSAARVFPAREIPAYITAQLVGAVAASATLHLLFPEHKGLGATLPAGGAMQSFVLEFLLTLGLVLVILCAAVRPAPHPALAGVAIGGVIGLEAMFAGPICGASMNPARSIGPALLSGNTTALWIYIAAPVLGALSAVPIWRILVPDTESASAG